jgi:hypothetical protein
MVNSEESICNTEYDTTDEVLHKPVSLYPASTELWSHLCDIVINVQAVMTDYKSDKKGDILSGARACKILQDNIL